MNHARIRQLRDHIASLPERKFDMAVIAARGALRGHSIPPAELSECGTSACLAGWTIFLFGTEAQQQDRYDLTKATQIAGDLLDIPRIAPHVFMGYWAEREYDDKGSRHERLSSITRDETIAYLDMLLAKETPQ